MKRRRVEAVVEDRSSDTSQESEAVSEAAGPARKWLSVAAGLGVAAIVIGIIVWWVSDDEAASDAVVFEPIDTVQAANDPVAFDELPVKWSNIDLPDELGRAVQIAVDGNTLFATGENGLAFTDDLETWKVVDIADVVAETDLGIDSETVLRGFFPNVSASGDTIALGGALHVLDSPQDGCDNTANPLVVVYSHDRGATWSAAAVGDPGLEGGRFSADIDTFPQVAAVDGAVLAADGQWTILDVDCVLRQNGFDFNSDFTEEFSDTAVEVTDPETRERITVAFDELNLNEAELIAMRALATSDPVPHGNPAIRIERDGTITELDVIAQDIDTAHGAVIATEWFSPRVFRSIDGGTTWAQLPHGGEVWMGTYSTERVLGGERDEQSVISVNGGATWTSPGLGPSVQPAMISSADDVLVALSDRVALDGTGFKSIEYRTILSLRFNDEAWTHQLVAEATGFERSHDVAILDGRIIVLGDGPSGSSLAVGELDR
ncbi:MAG: hypothetical protein GY925_09030 [Actinomycetia bacterium]|nr:hypothetical protein [Actinomycetes bacterium]